MRARRYVLVPVLLVVLAGLLTAQLTGALGSLARHGLYATGLLTDGGAPTLPAGALSTPATPSGPASSEAPTGQGPRPVLTPVTRGALPRPAALARRIDGVDRSEAPGRLHATVVDVGTGRVVYDRGGSTPAIPASTLKLLVSTAALSVLGPERRFNTRVVDAGGGGIVLVGGGDPYLQLAAPTGADPARAGAPDPDESSVAVLADRTAKALKKAGRRSVDLGYDTSLFSGPAWNPDWPAAYADQVTPVSALWVGEGRVVDGGGQRVADAPRAAARAFAAALERHGVQVGRVRATRAAAGAAPLASVASLPLDRIVERLLMRSDNDAAEVVARQAALGAGRPGSSVAARAVVLDRLEKLGLPVEGVRIRDGSGLSRGNRVPPQVMAQLLRLDLTEVHPELRAVATGLPVAGVEGTLRERFDESGTGAGRGLVRGKSGTLTGVHSLAGYVRTADGSLLTYAFVLNDAEDYDASRDWLDRAATAVSACGCR